MDCSLLLLIETSEIANNEGKPFPCRTIIIVIISTIIVISSMVMIIVIDNLVNLPIDENLPIFFILLFLSLTSEICYVRR